MAENKKVIYNYLNNGQLWHIDVDNFRLLAEYMFWRHGRPFYNKSNSQHLSVLHHFSLPRHSGRSML